MGTQLTTKDSDEQFLQSYINSNITCQPPITMCATEEHDL